MAGRPRWRAHHLSTCSESASRGAILQRGRAPQLPPHPLGDPVLRAFTHHNEHIGCVYSIEGVVLSSTEGALLLCIVAWVYADHNWASAGFLLHSLTPLTPEVVIQA